MSVEGENSWWVAIFSECEGFSLFVAVGGNVAALRESCCDRREIPCTAETCLC